jgi:hypothetical protein
VAALTDFARDILTARGALVEAENGNAIRAMLPADTAHSLEAAEWLSLRFGAGAGSDDEGDWLDRLGRLLPEGPRIAHARVRRSRPVRAIDPGTLLDRELVIQNGIFRPVDHGPATARYYFFTLPYTIESDEKTLGVWTAALNASVNSMPRQPELLLQTIADEIEADPAGAIPEGELPRVMAAALRSAQPEIRRLSAAAEQSAKRRLGRDSERIHTYYEGMLRQVHKRRRSAEAEGEEKARSRAEAIERDRAAKLEDLARKYALKIRIDAGDILAVSLPVVEISVRVIRKKEERVAGFHWNTVLGKLEARWCEGCFAAAHPLFLCDTRVHFLCRECAGPCERCGRHLCRACQPKCRCGD